MTHPAQNARRPLRAPEAMPQGRTAVRRLREILAACLLSTAAAGAHAEALQVVIEGVTRAEGTMNVALYDSEAGFRKTMARAQRLPARAGAMTVTFDDLPAGDYAVLVFQDLDGDETLDSNLFGLPTEPWGASLLGRSVFGAPGWKDTRFPLPGTAQPVRVRLSD